MIVEKAFDYQTELTVAAGQIGLNSLAMQGDGDFVLRSVFLTPNSPGSNLASAIRMRRPNGDFIQKRRMEAGAIFFGLDGPNQIPIYPEVLYPRHSSFEYEIFNATGGDVTYTVLLRGVKRVEREVCCWYPDRYEERPFDLVEYDTLTPDGFIRSRVVENPYGEDLVFRAIAGSFDAAVTFDQPGDLRYQFRDSSGWFYSNVPIIWRFLIGENFPHYPRPFYPEIYIPRREVFMYDVFRADGAGNDSRTMLRFIGARILEVGG